MEVACWAPVNTPSRCDMPTPQYPSHMLGVRLEGLTVGGKRRRGRECTGKRRTSLVGDDSEVCKDSDDASRIKETRSNFCYRLGK